MNFFQRMVSKVKSSFESQSASYWTAKAISMVIFLAFFGTLYKLHGITLLSLEGLWLVLLYASAELTAVAEHILKK